SCSGCSSCSPSRAPSRRSFTRFFSEGARPIDQCDRGREQWIKGTTTENHRNKAPAARARRGAAERARVGVGPHTRKERNARSRRSRVIRGFRSSLCYVWWSVDQQQREDRDVTASYPFKPTRHG